MVLNLRLELLHKHPDLCCVLADVRDVMKRIPEQTFRQDTPFVVTIFHLTRLVAKLAGNVTPIDGWLCFVGDGEHITTRAHSWLATQRAPYLIDLISPDTTSDPHLVNVGSNAIWRNSYRQHPGVIKDHAPTDIERQVALLIDTIDSPRPRFHSSP